MRKLTNEEMTAVSGGSGKNTTGVGVNVLTFDILNHNNICIGDIASNNLNGNSFLNENVILNDLVDILS
jgi:hypothetical protein